MPVKQSFLKKLFLISTVIIFSISTIFFSINSFTPKSASALEIDKCLAKDANSKNLSTIYNYNNYNSRYNYARQGCDLIQNSILCLLSTCNNGIDNTNIEFANSFFCQANGAYYSDIYSLNNLCYNNQPAFNKFTSNNCINCFEQAIIELQNNLDYNLGNANINYDLLNNIVNSQRLDIPTSVVSSVNRNTVTTEVRNYNGSVLASTSFSIDDLGNTSVNNSNSSVIPNCYRRFDVYLCESISTMQVGNQFGSYSTISTGFKSTFIISQNQSNPTPNYSFGSNYPVLFDYYGNDCTYSFFGCSY